MPKEEEIEEESELEEETEEEYEEIDNQQFTQFMQTQRVAPSLEISEISQPELEQNIISTSTINKDKSQIKYDVAIEEQKRKYEIESQGIEAPVLRLTTKEDISRPQFVNPLQGRNIHPDDDIEPRMMEAGAINTKRGLPFEEKKKYKEVKL